MAALIASERGTRMLDQRSTQVGRSIASSINSRPQVAAYARAYSDRQRRFDARSARRSGDWFILEVPTALLWLDDEDVPTPDNPWGWWPSVEAGIWS
jgi:hypothetical protein